jgi:very-short-patch-repair endonuclease
MDRDFDVRINRIAERQHALVSVDQVTLEGGTFGAVDHRLRSNRWRHAERGVYAIVGAPETWHQRLLAAVLAVGADAVAGGRSAAALHRLPGFHPTPVEVLVLRPCQRKPQHGVVRQTKRLPARHVTTVESIPVTAIPRTVFDLATNELPAGRVERALDHALAYELAPIERFWDVFLDLAKRGRKGTTLMRALLLARGPDHVAPASELEARFLELLRTHRLPRPEQQVDLGDADGWVGRVDFYFRSVGLVVEADGRRYHSALLDRENDRVRDARLRAAGLEVVRLTWQDIVERPVECATWLSEELRQRAA